MNCVAVTALSLLQEQVGALPTLPKALTQGIHYLHCGDQRLCVPRGRPLGLEPVRRV